MKSQSGFISSGMHSSDAQDTAKGSHVHFNTSPTIHKYTPGSPPSSIPTQPERCNRSDFKRMNSIPNSITSTASAFEGEKWRAAFDIYTSAFGDLERHYSALQKRQRSNGGSVSSTADYEAETILTGLTYVDELKTARDAYNSGLPSQETISALRRSAGFSKGHARSMYRTSRAQVKHMEAVVKAAELSWTEKRELFEDTYKRKLSLD